MHRKFPFPPARILAALLALCVAALAGATYAVEWSDTLDAPSWSTVGVTEQILSSNATTQSVKAMIPAGAGGQRFFRLSYTNTPLRKRGAGRPASTANACPQDYE